MEENEAALLLSVWTRNFQSDADDQICVIWQRKIENFRGIKK